jgi:hypothetical protein
MGEDSRDPPLSRRVPGATRPDGPKSVSRRLPDSLLERMRAAVDAAPERAARQENAACQERPAAPLRRVSGVSDDRRPPAGPVRSASSLAGDPAEDDDTQPIPVISGSASGDILSPPAGDISAQPDPVPEPEPEPAVDLEPEPSFEPGHVGEPEPAAEPAAAEPEPALAAELEPEYGFEADFAPGPPFELEPGEPEPACEPEPVFESEPAAERPANHEPALAMHARAEGRVQRTSGWRDALSRRGMAGVLAAAAILIVAGLLALTLSRHAGDGHRPGRGATAAGTATGNRAADWVAAQVSRAVTVSCDPAMCQLLVRHGIPAGDLLWLRPGGASPFRSQVVVATPAIRSEFGSSIESAYAPGVLASFGYGNQQIDIRVIASHGAAAYESALAKDLQARKAYGSALLNSGRVTASASARRQLAAGQVDARLLLSISNMAPSYPIYIVAFGDSGPGASAGSPLRSAELTQPDAVPRPTTSVYMRAMFAVLRAQPSQFVPMHASTARIAGGRIVLRIEFAAPSPLGLLGRFPS